MEIGRVKFIRSPIKAAGLLFGIGIAAFFEAIILREIFALHSMLSNQISFENAAEIRLDQFWGGIYLLCAWAITNLGIISLWRSGKRPDVPWRRLALLGSIFVGSGLFFLLEGLVNHQILELHHIVQNTRQSIRVAWDMAYLLFGSAFIGYGSWLIGKDDQAAKEELASVTHIRRSRAI